MSETDDEKKLLIKFSEIFSIAKILKDVVVTQIKQQFLPNALVQQYATSLRNQFLE